MGSGTWSDRHTCASCNVIQLFGAAASRPFRSSISYICILAEIQEVKVVFDNMCMNCCGGNKFQAVDWKDFYLEASEPIPPNVPEPCGKCVQLNCFMDADQAGNQITRQSHTGVLLFVCRAPITWYSK